MISYFYQLSLLCLLSLQGIFFMEEEEPYLAFSVQKKEDSTTVNHPQNRLPVVQVQENYIPSKIKFKHIGAQEGLSQGHGVAILQDSQGFMWFGTLDGLNKYNGYQMTVYRNDSKDTALLTNNQITCIYEDRENNLWVGTPTGLNRLDRNSEKFKHYKNDPYIPGSIKANSIHSIVQDKKGNLWISTRGGGLNLYNPKNDSFTSFIPDPNNPGSINDLFVSCIYEDLKGNLWLGTRSGGVNFFDVAKKTFTAFKHNPGDSLTLSSNNITKIVEDGNGKLWISTWDGGLNLFDPQTKEAKRFRHSDKNKKSLASDVIFTILRDKKGNLWVGTENGGLNLFNPITNNFERYTHNVNNPNSLKNNSVSALYEDRSGNIWVGVHRGGIDFFNLDLEKFQHYYQELSGSGLSHNNVKSFYEDKKGQLWIGTDGGGLNLYDPKKDSFKHFYTTPADPKSISSNVILSSLEDKEGFLWFGTWEGGLNKFDPENNSFKNFKHNSGDQTSIGSNTQWVLWEDRSGNLWIGTYGQGLNRFDKKKKNFARFKHNPTDPNSLCDDNVKAIAEEKNGGLWIGTGNGLDFFDVENERFFHYKSVSGDTNTLSSNDINSLLIDQEGNLWVGTQKGLNLFDKKTKRFKQYTEIDGLCNNSIQGLLQDDRGTIWISTLNGLSRFDKNTFQNYYESDGLQGNEFSQNACFKSKDGRLYFGGINGFNSFNPDSIRINPFIPPVYITNFQLFNKSVVVGGKDSPFKTSFSQSKEIELTHEQSVISFEFVALNYYAAENNHYAYKLEGFDEEWNYVGNQRKATYTNLDPGSYVFKVKASNNDGIWNETGTSLNIIIKPPFWKTWWFRGTSILLVLALGLTAHNLRTRRIKDRNRKLESKVFERTVKIEKQKQEISTHLEKLKMYNEEIRDQKEELERKVAERTKELQASNEELLLLTNALPVLITYVDQQQRYRFNNKAYEEWFGISRAGVYGRHLSEVIGEKVYSKVKEWVDKALSGEACHFEIWMPFPRLGNRFVSIDYIPHWQEGEVVGYYALVSDITEQEKVKQDLKVALQETRQTNEQLKKINVDLDNFVYTASHDLKSPIANLEGITTFLTRRLDAKLDEKEREVLVMIHTMTTKLKATIGDLTEISKVQKDLDQSAEPISFEHMMEDILADLRPIILESRAVIETDWEEQEIYYARKNLRSILYNLVGNALKYHSPDRLPHIALRTFRQGDEIILTVQDNGLGMAPYQVSKLFTMFKRFHSHVEGTGIGLYIIKRIIENYGGRIEVETELNKGTTFKVCFKQALTQ